MDILETVLAVMAGTFFGRWIYDWAKAKVEIYDSVYPYYWRCPVETCQFEARATDQKILDELEREHLKRGLHGYRQV